MCRMNRMLASSAAVSVFSAQPRRAPSKTSVAQRTPHPANPVNPGYPASDAIAIQGLQPFSPCRCAAPSCKSCSSWPSCFRSRIYKMHRRNRIIAAAAAATVFSAQPRRAPSKTSVVQRTPSSCKSCKSWLSCFRHLRDFPQHRVAQQNLQS